ncbi:tetratricopeptide repeat protein [Paraburkholderia azotifigens]|uniref:Tetratricopeptide repeat protein n=1 Tax=Paraburkholderia azotifigens TaxID=2057004 RepID=A0A5C6VEC7_9BURK|nr:tetratricopeptide repeat protein [Paraburkholderia azotifigens]TXC83742.1 tetratricopeptide repeat protein [Paraburkholderia azotifigens]
MSKPNAQQRRLDALLHQAVAMQQNGAHAEAEEIYREILAERPMHLDALQLLGALALQTGRIGEGIELLKKAISINSRHAPLHSNLAYSYNAQRRFGEGLASANRALALQPAFADALNNRGNALAGLDRPAEALESFDKALALQPELAQAWNNRACVLRDLDRPAEAMTNCNQAIALQSSYAEAWSNRANALSDMNRPLDAQASYQRALELAPHFADAWNNLGLAFVDSKQHDEALRSYERALSLAPDSAEAHWNYALCLLQTGQLEQGWREYEWRWQRHRIAASQRGFTQPLWLGDFPLEGRTILLHAEQGLGDTLQFCRYAPLVAARGARVILEVPKELMRLLATLDGVTELVEQGQPVPAFDCQAPLLSLPLAFGTDLTSIPSTTPYLFADHIAAKSWAERLASEGSAALKVGIVWAGGNRPHVAELRKTDSRRSMALDTLKPILDVPTVRFYSLQKGPAALRLRERPELASRVVDHTDEFDDFADTAAFVDNLDLVITVDTAVAHLAGALGKEVWIMNRLDTCWRWLLDRTDSPWYPGAKLFRQATLGDWSGVVEAVRDALAERALPAE